MALPKEFKVITWAFNEDKMEWYDVIPYFVRMYKSIKKSVDRPKTFEEFKSFVKKEGYYLFWAKCEWEVIVHGWPVYKADHKMDVWEQIENNLDNVVEILMNAVPKPRQRKTKTQND